MPRDMNLTCMILSYVSDAKVPGHIQLPTFKGYMDIVVDTMTKKPTAIVRMTWNSHEALDRRCQ